MLETNFLAALKLTVSDLEGKADDCKEVIIVNGLLYCKQVA